MLKIIPTCILLFLLSGLVKSQDASNANTGTGAGGATTPGGCYTCSSVGGAVNCAPSAACTADTAMGAKHEAIKALNNDKLNKIADATTAVCYKVTLTTPAAGVYTGCGDKDACAAVAAPATCAVCAGEDCNLKKGAGAGPAAPTNTSNASNTTGKNGAVVVASHANLWIYQLVIAIVLKLLLL